MKRTMRNLDTSRSSRLNNTISRATAAVFEQMEQRQLMSGTLTIAPANPSDSIVLDVAANGGIIKIVNGAQTTYSPGQWSDVLVHGQAVTVRGSTVPVLISTAQASVITIGGPAGLQKIKADVKFDAVGVPSTFNINDTGDNSPRNAVMSEYGGFVEIKNFAPANIDLNPNCVGALNVTTGGGDDTFTAKWVPANSSLNMDSAGGTDTVVLGGGTGGSAYIFGPVTINNTPAFTHLVIDDSSSTDALFMYLGGDGTYDTVGGMTTAQVNYKAADVADVTLDMPSGGNSVLVARTDKPVNFFGTTAALFKSDDIQIGGGAAGMTDIHATVSISNPKGITDIELEDSNDPNSRLIQVNKNPITQLSSVTGMSGGAVQWVSSDGVGLTLDTPHVGGNGIVVHNIDANNVVWINGGSPLGGPNDVVTVGDSGSVQGIAGPLKIKNAGYTALTIDDSADPVARNATLDMDSNQPVDEWELAGLAPTPIYFYDLDVSNVTIKGGSGGTPLPSATPWARTPSVQSPSTSSAVRATIRSTFSAW
jgi:hypothetical protein